MGIGDLVALIGLDARVLSILGQSLGLLSAVMLFFWGSAGWKVLKSGQVQSPNVQLEFDDPRRPRAVRWMRFRYNVLSKVALVMLGLSFFAQLLALWAPPPA